MNSPAVLRRPAQEGGPSPNLSRRRERGKQLAMAYVALTKPRIIVLLLITALGAMFIAAKGAPPLQATLLVMIGGTLAAGGANALNHYLDRDIDQMMSRTRKRPLPSQKIEPRNALVFGIALNVLAFTILATWVNVLSASLAVSATAFYIFIYTSWLKRTSTQNIVIGGAAGAFPPLVGWAAVTGDLNLAALYLFAIIFFWTPPHFWALALMLEKDYREAGIPMLPVVRGVRETTQAIMLHSLTLIAITVLFYTVDGVGYIYLSGAVALGAVFLWKAAKLLRTQSIKDARSLYLYSLLYLALLFGFMVADAVA
ncbi:MAG: protoheme IX farnesyltransferase [Chloroflexi bacterium]|nr:protoheme IX farnesyltransferase [Chloroflexota bacterium]